jgi:Protein of unknown function (DUF3108)
MNRLKTYLLILLPLALAIFVVGDARPVVKSQSLPARSLPFARGEQLVYLAEFKRSLLRGIDVAEFSFSASADESRDVHQLRLSGDVASKGLFLKLVGFRFHQHVDSIAAANPLTVLQTNKLYEQNGRSWKSEATFDHQTHKAVWTIHNQNETQAPSPSAVEFSEPVQDVLTVIYFVRTLPLETGKTFDVPLSDGGKVWRFSVTVYEKKRLNTVLGNVNAVRVEPTLFGADNVVRRRGSLSIWITDDARRLPVKAQLKVDMGTFDIRLKKVSYTQAQ